MSAPRMLEAAAKGSAPQARPRSTGTAAGETAKEVEEMVLVGAGMEAAGETALVEEEMAVVGKVAVETAWAEEEKAGVAAATAARTSCTGRRRS